MSPWGWDGLCGDAWGIWGEISGLESWFLTWTGALHGLGPARASEVSGLQSVLCMECLGVSQSVMSSCQGGKRGVHG